LRPKDSEVAPIVLADNATLVRVDLPAAR